MSPPQDAHPDASQPHSRPEHASEGDTPTLRAITAHALGDPAPQGSKSRDRHGRMYESSKRLKPWREIVAYTVMAARKGVQFAGPVRVLLSFDLRLNADLDKLCRGVLDGLTMSGAIVDDKQVVELHAEKRMRKPAGCRIRIEEMH